MPNVAHAQCAVCPPPFDPRYILLHANWMQPPFLRELGFSPFQAASAPSGAMVIYALGYVLLLVYLAVRTFQARDL